jgi:uncharacterized membrane protein
MDGIRRRIGWIAIGLGAVALVVALATNGWFPGFAGGRSARFDGQQQQGQQLPQQGQQRQQGQQLPQQGQQRQRGQQLPQQGQQGQGGSRGGLAMSRPDGGFGGAGGWLGMGWRLVRNAAQIALAAILVLLGFQILRRRNGNQRRDGEGTGGDSGPSTDRPAATGETQSLG